MPNGTIPKLDPASHKPGFIAVLPWILSIALAGGMYAFYISGKSKDEELSNLRLVSQQIDKLRAEITQSQNAPVLSGELDRLRDEAAKLQAENAKLRNSSQQMRQLTVENQQLRDESLQAQQARASAQTESMANACNINLRNIEAAKTQLVREEKKAKTGFINWAALTVFLPGGVLPTCPASGAYTINSIGVNATCTIPGHQL